jgi:cytochrome c oxidase subunit 2
MTKSKNKILWSAFGLLAICAAVVAFVSPALAETVIGAPKNWQLGFQEAASPSKEKMEWFHNSLLMPILTGIVIFVTGLLVYVMIRFNARANPVPSKTTHNVMLEVIWTLVPVLILVIIAVPSMKMLYFVDKTQEAEMTLKVTGYQWYWGYEYPDHGGVNFLSNMLKKEELTDGRPYLLATDNVVVLPVDTNIRLNVTASDVLHAWAVPAFGIKVDSVPGRLNETWVRITKEGTYYGQCSELCGTNHGFMPIEVRAVSKEKFAEWIKAQGGKLPEEIKAEQDKAAAQEAAKEEKAGE